MAKKIKHEYGQTKIIRLLFPRWKRYRFRFLSARTICMILLVIVPFYSSITFLWLIFLFVVYQYNSFFIDHCDRLIYQVTGYKPSAHRAQQLNPNNKESPGADEMKKAVRDSEPDCDSSDEISAIIGQHKRTAASECSSRGKLKQFWSSMKRNFGQQTPSSRPATPVIVCDSSDSEPYDQKQVKSSSQSKTNKRPSWKWSSGRKKSKNQARLYSSHPDLSRTNLHEDCLNLTAVSDVEDSASGNMLDIAPVTGNYLDVNNNSPNYSESESEEITVTERKPEKWSNHSPTMFRLRKLKKEIQRCVNRQRDHSSHGGSRKAPLSSATVSCVQPKPHQNHQTTTPMPIERPASPPTNAQQPTCTFQINSEHDPKHGLANYQRPTGNVVEESSQVQRQEKEEQEQEQGEEKERETDTITAMVNPRPAKPGNRFSLARAGRNSSHESDSDQVAEDGDMVPRKISLDTSENYDEILRNQRIHRLLKYPFFQVDIHLQCGQGLLAKDSSGTSDPYVKFKIGNQIVHKSQTIFKTLNPVWDEYFVLSTNNIYDPIVMKVYDYDYLMLDDYLGTTAIDLTRLEPGVTTDLELDLYDDSKSTNSQKMENRGKIFLSAKLNPKTQEEREYYYGRGRWTTTVGADGQPSKKTKSQPYDGIVSVVLIKGSDINLEGDYCMRLKLGSEKFKSRVVSKSVQSPYWAQEFTMHMFADQPKMLEMTLGLAGTTNQDLSDKVCLDLSRLEPEKTHKFNQQFHFPVNPKISGAKPKKPGVVEMLVTITGTQLVKGTGSPETAVASSETNSNIETTASSVALVSNSSNRPLKNVVTDTVSRLYDNFFDVGTLTVKVHRAENLASADINGKSDPFCVLELVNERLRTNTEYKTLSPEWNKTFKLKIHDLHDVLEITVYDEDRDRVEFLGKVAIPLLKIKNGEKHWYALKDKKLKQRVKGHILLECEISYNIVKASLITFGPRRTKYIQPEVKFKRSLFIRNVMRLKQIGLEILEAGQWLHSCIQWESPSRSIIAFLTFLTFVYYFEFYMIPLILLLFVMKTYIVSKFKSYMHDSDHEPNDDSDQEDDFIDETKMDDEYEGNEKKSLKERIVTVQEISVLLMNIVGLIASSTNFTVPYLTWLGVLVLTGCTILFYFIPVRYLILIWGINKFTKKFRCPDGVNNNEVIDFLSRVPDNEELMMYKEFKPSINYDSEGRILPATTGTTTVNVHSRSMSPDSNSSRCSSPAVSGSPGTSNRKEKKKNK